MVLCFLFVILCNLEGLNKGGDFGDEERRIEKIVELLFRMVFMVKKLMVIIKGDGSLKVD